MDEQTVVFDRLIKTATGYVCGLQTQALQEGEIPMPGMALVATQSMPIEKFHRPLAHPSYALTRATAERMGITLTGMTEKYDTNNLAKIRAKSIKAEEPQVSLEKGDLGPTGL